jgi:hypothetical protein
MPLYSCAQEPVMLNLSKTQWIAKKGVEIVEDQVEDIIVYEWTLY